MTLKKLKKEPAFFSFLAAFVGSLGGTLDVLDVLIASAGNLALAGLAASEGSIGEEGFVDVEKRGVVGTVVGVVAEKVEVGVVLGESV